jgi:hypothetical protein
MLGWVMQAIIVTLFFRHFSHCWEGTLRYHMASFNGAAYSHSIRDENGLASLSTGPVVGDLYLDFLYREELNGVLTFSTVRHVGPAVDNVGSQLFCLSN